MEDFEEASKDEEIRQPFKIDEALLDLDVKLGDFAETHIEVGNYRQKVKEKYEALDFLDATQVIEIIKKFKSRVNAQSWVTISQKSNSRNETS